MEASYVIDIGTSSIRGILFNSKGDILLKEQMNTFPESQIEGIVEQSPEVWKDHVITLCSNISKYLEENDLYLKGIALTSQRSSLICLDSNHQPLYKTIMWQDTRANKYAGDLEEYNKLFIRKTGSRVNSVYLALKIRMFQKDFPELASKVNKYVTIADYVTYLLTGEFKTDYTYGSRTHLMNIHTKQWDTELIDIFDIKESQLCELIPPGTVAGYLHQRFAEETKLPAGIPVISSGGDQQCSSVGLGLLNEGDIGLNLGTGAFITAIKAKKDAEEVIITPNIIFNAYALQNDYFLETNVLTCTIAIEWFFNTFYENKDRQERYKLLGAIVRKSPIGSNGLLFLPYFRGRGTPDWNSTLTGSLFGLTLSHTKEDILNALIEGLGFEIKNQIDTLERYLQKKVKHIPVAGGLTNNSAVLQKLSDILNRELRYYSNPEGTAIGAFVNSSIKLGFFSNLQEAYRSCRRNDDVITYTPNNENSSSYEQIHKNYNTYNGINDF